MSGNDYFNFKSPERKESISPAESGKNDSKNYMMNNLMTTPTIRSPKEIYTASQNETIKTHMFGPLRNDKTEYLTGDHQNKGKSYPKFPLSASTSKHHITSPSESSLTSSRRPSMGTYISSFPVITKHSPHAHLANARKMRSPSSSKDELVNSVTFNEDNNVIINNISDSNFINKRNSLENTQSTCRVVSGIATPYNQEPMTPMSTYGSDTPTSPNDHSSSKSDLGASVLSSPSKIMYSSITSASSVRAFKKQYVLNEQIYLSKLKNIMPDDDYYTKRIIPTESLTDEEEDNIGDSVIFKDVDFEVDSANKTNNNHTVEFGTNYHTASSISNEDIISIHQEPLRECLEWLKSSDDSSQNSIISQFFEKMNQNGIMDLNLLSRDPIISDRLTWQRMLSKVLHGDIVKSETSRISKKVKNPNFTKKYADDIWIDLKCWMSGKNRQAFTKTLSILRDSTDSLFEKILNFTIPEDILDDADKIELYLDDLTTQYYKAINLWPNMKSLFSDKPIVKSGAFVKRINAINSWLNIKSNFRTKIEILNTWIGDEHLNSSITNHFYSYNYEVGGRKLFIEQLIKEKDIENIFQRKIFFPMAPWILKTKLLYLNYGDVMEDLKLKFDNDEIDFILLFPIHLIKDIITIRLEYAKKLKNPTLMMVDQTIDDFMSYIRLATQLKLTFNEFCSNWPFDVKLVTDFDTLVIEAITYVFKLFHLKVLEETRVSYRFFKDTDTTVKYWEELKNVGQYIENSGTLIAHESTRLVLRILNRLQAYNLQQQTSLPPFKKESDAEKWLIDIFENLGSMKRKINRFSNILTKAYQNAVRYKVENFDDLLLNLQNTGHFLLYSGGELENNGIYVFGSSELLGCEDKDIYDILNNKDIGSDLIPELEIQNSLSLYNATNSNIDPNKIIVKEIDSNGRSYFYRNDSHFRSLHLKNIRNKHGYNEETASSYSQNSEEELSKLEMKLQSLGYLLILQPAEPIMWSGDIYNLTDKTPIFLQQLTIDINPGTVVLLNQGSSYGLDYQCSRLNMLGCTTFVEKLCSYKPVENNLQRINKSYFRITYSVLHNYSKYVKTFSKLCPTNDLTNSIFVFTRDFGTNFLKNNVANREKKSAIIFLLIKLSIQWLIFLIDHCDPSDKKTFRWCVPAMEFAMRVIDGWNILSLDSEGFSALKRKVAACISLLISHFDVMGARTLFTDTTIPSVRSNNIEIQKNVQDDDEIMILNSQIHLEAIEKLEQSIKGSSIKVGKVLDDSEKTNKYILSLASSISNVSIRWQKRKFIGGGTFGDVYSAINLDTGKVLAVKEIRIQDIKAMEKIFPLVKEEMEVLEMLNHPNVVEYYGVEVHRDKVSIFMEYCDSGSLASLLEHGRIEDEMVSQIYVLQLMEGLAYLHHSGVIHRDIKPENILLDANGVIKYVDFGAAKKIASNGSKMLHLSRYLASEEHGAPELSSSNNMKALIGTPMYMAPETITGSPKKGKFGAEDVWSLGCVILEMVTGRKPWGNLDNEWAIMYNVAAGQVPPFPTEEEMSTMGTDFLHRLLVDQPAKRATAVELLVDPWIVEIRELAFGCTDDVEN